MGFTNIELSGGTKYYEGYLDDLLSLKEEFSLSFNVHNYFPPPKEDFVLNLIDIDERNAALSTETISEGVRVSKTLGASSYAFHPGYTVVMSPEKKDGYFVYKKDEPFDKQEKEELFYERFETLLEGLPKERPPLCIENLFPFNSEEDFSLFTRPEEVMRFLERYRDLPDVGLLLDLGHLNVSSHYLGFDKITFIRDLVADFPHKIFGMHLSENDGTVDGHQGAESGSWQVAMVKRNQSLLRDIPVTLEWRNIGDCMDRVRELEAF
jgi:sugar phosphate isomerase/epimerase